MYSKWRKLYSQNFLHNRKLVSSLVDKSSIGKKDTILEIGPGNGIITDELIKQASQVIAVEIDSYLYRYLQQKYQNTNNISLFNQDFLRYDLPQLPYKVFANIPFAIEGKIIRKLLEANNPPQDCYLVIMKELAVRLQATNQENMFSCMHKPWFDFAIVYRFNKFDFVPIPSVNAVLFRINKKNKSLLDGNERKTYQKFITTTFGSGQTIRNNLKTTHPLEKIDAIMHRLGISKKAKPTHLDLDQWLFLYKALSKR